jgi:succinyl-CoA synthetase alpha subunit
VPLAQDTVQITARAAPICGAVAAEKIALKQAAVETIRRGYDRFIVVNAQAGGTYRGNTPIVVQNMGGGTAIASGGDPIIAPNQGLVIKMFKEGDPQGTNALPARDTLGPDWQEQIKKDSMTCL